MDQLSRRDAVYHSLDQISSALRPNIGSRQQQEHPSSGSSSSIAGRRNNNAVSTLPLGLASPTSPTAAGLAPPPSIPIPTTRGSSTSPLSSPPISPSRSLSGGPLEYLNRVGSSLAGALQNSPLNGAPDDVSPRFNPNRISSLYNSLGPILPPQARSSSQQRPPLPISPRRENTEQQAVEEQQQQEEEEDLLPHQIDSIHGIQSAAQSTESLLPDYSRGSLPSISQAVKYQHSISTPSNKIELTLESIGSKEYPVYVQDVCPVVAGKVRLRIKGDENAQELRIRVKGESGKTWLFTCLKTYSEVKQQADYSALSLFIVR